MDSTPRSLIFTLSPPEFSVSFPTLLFNSKRFDPFLEEENRESVRDEHELLLSA